jgi:hypothetical protein
MIMRQATCRACGGPIPSREGRFALGYLLLRTAIKTDPGTRGDFQRASIAILTATVELAYLPVSRWRTPDAA